jgi:RES domain-containing protein
MHHSTVNRIRREILEQIVGCYNCQPWDEGAPVWLGPHTQIYELCSEFEIADSDWKKILANVECPFCHTALGEPYCEVATRSEIDSQIEKIFDRLRDKRTTNSLKRFNDFLSKYPYLGSHSSLGDTLFQSIKNGRRYSVKKNEEWYRARLVGQENRLYSSSEMGAPDPKKIHLPEGRFNHTGQAFLYLSDNAETAHREINSQHLGISIIQKFELDGIRKLLDLRHDYSTISPKADIVFLAIIYNGYIEKVPKKGSSWKPEYFVTRYIADVARFLRFQGIVFRSTVHYGNNIVLFNPEHNGVRAVSDPFIFQSKPDTTEPPF